MSERHAKSIEAKRILAVAKKAYSKAIKKDFPLGSSLFLKRNSLAKGDWFIVTHVSEYNGDIHAVNSRTGKTWYNFDPIFAMENSK